MKSFFKKFMAIILVAITVFSVMSATAFSATVTNTEIVEYARTFEGVRYVWGGHSPSGFDCSGFVNYVFSQKGIELSDDSEWYKTVLNYGVEVNAEEALPGDIVVWAGHVGIYLGDGMCISALSGDTKKVTVHTVASFTGGSVKLYARPNGVDYGLGGYYHVTSDDYNATLTYNNGVFTATMIDPDLKDKYTVSSPDTQVNHGDHDWKIFFTDGNNHFQIGTSHWKKENEKEHELSLIEMGTHWWILQDDGKWHGHTMGVETPKIEGNKITWVFNFSEYFDRHPSPYFTEFDAENMVIEDVRIYHHDNENNSNTSDSNGNSILKTVTKILETIWSFIKKPFELLLGLFE